MYGHAVTEGSYTIGTLSQECVYSVSYVRVSINMYSKNYKRNKKLNSVVKN